MEAILPMSNETEFIKTINIYKETNKLRTIVYAQHK